MPDDEMTVEEAIEAIEKYRDEIDALVDEPAISGMASMMVGFAVEDLEQAIDDLQNNNARD